MRRYRSERITALGRIARALYISVKKRPWVDD